MSLSSQQYADLADDSYNIPPPTGKEVEIEGVTYKILEHTDQPSGYQGTIYQRVDTRDIVVAHRGTEQILKDGALADGGMVLARTNLQEADAIELTRYALEFAKQKGERSGHIPEVTVTGHSLGGTLAQITAHRFHLRGETFNAYGAVSLGYRIPEGGDRILNHVMAGDVVSGASHHYGQVRMYAKPEEVTSLQIGGYDNTRNPFDMRHPLVAASLSATVAASHNMHNFTNLDGDKKADLSVLGDPKAQRMAEQFGPMFDKYRRDVYVLRGGISLGASLARNVDGVLDEANHRLGSPLPLGHGLPPASDPGHPAAHAQSPSSTNKLLNQLDRMLAAVQTGDWDEFRKGTQTLANGEAGHAMRTEAIATVDRQEQQASQQAEQLQAAQRQAMQQENPVMRHGPRMH